MDLSLNLAKVIFRMSLVKDKIDLQLIWALDSKFVARATREGSRNLIAWRGYSEK